MKAEQSCEFGQSRRHVYGNDPYMTKSVILLEIGIVIFLVAFFNFSLCLRSLTHAGFMTGLGVDNAFGPDGAFEELERSAFHYMVGTRCYYLAIPIALWLFGPVWMAIGTGALLLIMNRVDH